MEPESPSRLDPASLEACCRRAAAGDADALERLLWTHHGRFIGLVRRKVGVDWQGRIEPDDVLQDAYVDIFGHIAEFTFADADSFYRWAARIIDHKFIDQVRRLRAKRRDVAREVPAGSSPSRHESFLGRCLPDIQTPSRVVRRDEAVGALMSCIARLPEHYRLVVRRFYLNDEPLAMIAADLDRSEDATRRLASRALARLSACLQNASRYLSAGT